MKKFALLGNPNCGKTTLFNSLTGSTAHVGNWPGVTVDKKEGEYKKCPEPVSIVDLPGIYSLSPYTPEEVVSRNFILDEKPDCVINVVDATNLERNLYLTTQIMEIDVPMVVALNMIDVLEKNGDKIDSKELEKRIGLPVVEISALRDTNLDELMNRAYAESVKARKGITVLEDSALRHLIGDCRIALTGQGVDNALFHAIKLAELDEIEMQSHPDSAVMVNEFKSTFCDDLFGTDFEAIVADSRYKYITKHYAPTLTKRVRKSGSTRSDKIDRVLTHKIWGLPIFLVILFMVFHLTFGEDLFYLGAMGVFDKSIYAYGADGQVIDVNETTYDDNTVYYDKNGFEAELVFSGGNLVEVNPLPYVYLQGGERILAKEAYEMDDTSFYADKDCLRPVRIYEVDGVAKVEYVSALDEFLAGIDASTFFGYVDGIYSPGVIFANALTTLTDLITVAVTQGIVGAGASQWVVGLVCDGILGGLFAVLSFLPQILVLFLFFSILEDSGYMARIAFMLDRILRKFGLSGRSFMPMIMGFGCSVPAIINTRTLADENERTATIRVIPFFTCGAKLPILTAIAGGIAVKFGLSNPDLVTYGMYLLGVVTAFCSVLLMRNTTLKGEVPPFIMELPAYHLPGARNLALHLWDKAKHFIEKAFTVILASTIVIWFVSHFDWGWHYLPDENINQSILAGVAMLIQPVFTPLGFGSQLGTWGWVFVVSAGTGLIAKENVIASFGTLGACVLGSIIDVEIDGGSGAVITMIEATGIGVPGLIAFIAFNMLTIPCLAATATAKAELNSKTKFAWTLAFWVGTSYAVSSMIYLVGSWWWTAFIFVGIIAIAVSLIVLTNKGKIHPNVLVDKLKMRKRKKN